MPITQPVSGPAVRYGPRVLGDAEFKRQQETKKSVGADGVVYGERITGKSTAKAAPTPPIVDVPDFLVDAERGTQKEPAAEPKPNPVVPTDETWNQFYLRRKAEGATMPEMSAEWKEIKAQRVASDAANGPPSD